MNRLNFFTHSFLIYFLLLWGIFSLFGLTTAQQPKERKIPLLEFRDLALVDVIRAISEQAGLNIVCSEEASKTKINFVLRNVTAEQALDSFCEIHQLWYKRSYNGIYHIFTLEEYRRDVSTLEEEQTELFLLYYPNAIDVAFALADLYEDRVELNLGNSNNAQLRELAGRYQRFSLIENQGGQFDFLQTQQNAGSSNIRDAFLNVNDKEKREANLTKNIPNRELYKDLSKEEIETLEKAFANDPNIDRTILERLKARKQAAIYITVLLNQNRLLIRTTDKKAMAHLRELIKKLDVPTPLVLLEVKVLQVELGDDFNSVFDLAFTKNFYSGAFSDGEPAPPPTGSRFPGGTGVNRDDLIFQYVSGSFASRIQFLEEKNRVTTLATPLLLTANQEVSRIFAGDSVPIVQGFSETGTITNGQNIVVIPSNPISQLVDVGTSLLITPSINADRTVALQILQEISEVRRDGATLPISNNGNITKETVDTIKRRSLAGTVVAKDGLALAVGGLIEETIAKRHEQVPILGSIPLLGMLFRREVSTRKRSELVIIIRPHILNTAAESEETTLRLLEELSIHPNIPELRGTLKTYKPEDTLKGDTPLSDLHQVFKFHSDQEK